MTKSFQKINLSSLAFLLIVFFLLVFASCNQTFALIRREKKISVKEGSKCETTHGGEKLPTIVENHKLVVPVRRDNTTQGFTTLIVLTGENFASASLLFRSDKGWQVSEKNQIVFWQSNKEETTFWGEKKVNDAILDFSPNLKIDPQVSFGADHLMLVIRIPSEKLNGIIVQPALPPESPKYNYRKRYNVILDTKAPPNMHGMASLYQFLVLPLEPEYQLPDLPSRILDGLTAGDLVYPRMYSETTEIIDAEKADFSL